MMALPSQHLVPGPVDPAWVGELTAAADGRSGACTSFLGVIRADKAEGRAVARIDYSAYAPMAERIFGEIEESVRGEYGLHDIVIRHSVGAVDAGKASMLVFVRAGHRAEAFAGLRAAVEAVKSGAPVWKREIFTDGGSRWVEGEESQGAGPRPGATAGGFLRNAT